MIFLENIETCEEVSRVLLAAVPPKDKPEVQIMLKGTVIFDSSVEDDRACERQLNIYKGATSNLKPGFGIILTTAETAEGWNFYGICNVICAIPHEQLSA